jgi:hypothetical protein
MYMHMHIHICKYLYDHVYMHTYTENYKWLGSHIITDLSYEALAINALDGWHTTSRTTPRCTDNVRTGFSVLAEYTHMLFPSSLLQYMYFPELSQAALGFPKSPHECPPVYIYIYIHIYMYIYM